MMVLRGEILQALQDAFWFGHMAAQRPGDTHDTATAERQRVLRAVERQVGALVMRAYLAGAAWAFVALVVLCLLARSLRTGVW